MNYDYRAYSWGVKAAQDGLVLKDNPYSSMSRRAAWESGFRFEKHQSCGVSLQGFKSGTWQ